MHCWTSVGCHICDSVYYSHATIPVTAINLVLQSFKGQKTSCYSPFKCQKSHARVSRSEWDKMSQPWTGQNYRRLKCHIVTSHPLFHEILGWTVHLWVGMSIHRLNFKRLNFEWPNFERLNFERPNFERLNLERLNFKRPNFERLNLERLNFEKDPTSNNWTSNRTELRKWPDVIFKPHTGDLHTQSPWYPSLSNTFPQ
jgi:uncharacterized protein YjbI with pentapeptide repeats